MHDHLLHQTEGPFQCIICEEFVPTKRWNLGYKTCRECGEKTAVKARQTWTIVPYHKGNYTLVTNKEELKQLNQKSR